MSGQRDVAVQGLLHEEKPAAVEQGPQRCLALIRLPVLAEGGDVSVLFVAVQGEAESGRGGLQHLGHRVQARDVGLQPPGHLDLEVRQPVRGRGVGEGVGQPVGDVLLGCDLVAQQGISQTDGVAGDDRGERLGKPVGRLASCQFRMDRAELDAEQVLVNRARERGLAPAAEGIDRRPFHQAGSEVGQQRRDLLPAGPGCLLRVQPLPECEHRIVPGTGDQVGGVPDDPHHRRQVLLEPRDGSLVNHFGGNPSDAKPAQAVPSTEPRSSTNTCGSSVIDAIPYRNGKRVRIHRVRKETESTFSDIRVCRWAAVSVSRGHPTIGPRPQRRTPRMTAGASGTRRRGEPRALLPRSAAVPAAAHRA